MLNKTESVTRIKELVANRKAVILAHYYALPEIQDVADYVGDSLGLSHTAARTDAEVIVFCGVHFMAETAAILSPQKTVLLPDSNADCPMANMLTARQLANFRAAHPKAKVVTYVNSTAAVKALSDICCTSANAVAVVDSFPREQELIFAPDRNLGANICRKLDRPMYLWDGFCPTHERILPELVLQARAAHPEAELLVHPECRPAVVDLADYVGSTTGILNYCKNSTRSEFLIGTENGVLHSLQRDNPSKHFYPASPINDCPSMKLATLEKIIWALEDMSPVVRVDPQIAAQARLPIERMLEITG